MEIAWLPGEVATAVYNFLTLPGDPSWSEMLFLLGFFLLIPGSGVLAIVGAIYWIVRKSAFSRLATKLARVIALLLLADLAATIGLLVLPMALRQVGPWREIRDAIRADSDVIVAGLGSRRTLSDAEFARLGAEYGEKKFLLPGHPHVVRMMIRQTKYPYVGFDFGAGTVAHFDPQSMNCIYSD